MVMFEKRIFIPMPPNIPPPYSNQTPISPSNPWPMSASISGYPFPQMIKTATVHSTPSIDNYRRATVPLPHARQQRRRMYDALTVQREGNVPKELQGIPQYIKMPIAPGAGPDSYAVKKMSYGFDTGSFFVGGILGVIIGGIIFTATGRKVTSEIAQATSRRVSGYISG